MCSCRTLWGSCANVAGLARAIPGSSYGFSWGWDFFKSFSATLFRPNFRMGMTQVEAWTLIVFCIFRWLALRAQCGPVTEIIELVAKRYIER